MLVHQRVHSCVADAFPSGDETDLDLSTLKIFEIELRTGPTI